MLSGAQGSHSFGHTHCEASNASSAALLWEAFQTSSSLPEETHPPTQKGHRFSGVVNYTRQSVPGDAFLIPTVLTTDASLVGWGACLGNMLISGQWSPSNSLSHTNLLELQAVLLGVCSFLPHLVGHLLVILSDNTMEISYMNKQGRTMSKSLCKLAVGF